MPRVLVLGVPFLWSSLRPGLRRRGFAVIGCLYSEALGRTSWDAPRNQRPKPSTFRHPEALSRPHKQLCITLCMPGQKLPNSRPSNPSLRNPRLHPPQRIAFFADLTPASPMALLRGPPRAAGLCPAASFGAQGSGLRAQGSGLRA